MTGMEDGLFPGNRSIDDPKELEEERRLCYVGITRARERLTLCSARSRMINGETHLSRESVFVREIPDEYTERSDSSRPPRPSSYHFGGRESGWDGRGLPWDSGYRDSYGSGFVGGGTGAGEGTCAVSAVTGSEDRNAAWADSSGRRKPLACGKSFQIVKADHLDYEVGDRVQHQRFGEGVVKNIQDGSRDYEVTVDFDRHGTKKMFAGFANLKKL